MVKTKIAVLISGGGTNLQALINAQKDGDLRHGRICVVISSNPIAFGLKRAEEAGIDNYSVSKKELGSQEAFEAEIRRILDEYGIELIVLAGFMSILSEDFTRRYPEKIINVHPSLIPAFCGKGFYGLKVHEEALKYGVKVTGATVHFVNEIPDGGKIIAQKAVRIKENDDAKTLQKRVMQEAEWKLLPEAVEKVSKEIAKGKEEKMDVYKVTKIGDLIRDNSYVGRGVVIGKTPDGSKAVTAYFIMGRSANSRNRVFEKRGDDLYTRAFDESKVEDPSLIIYAAVRGFENKLVVTNGDQTDTVIEFLEKGGTFEEALNTREFEPDYPNFTPRISGMMTFADGDFSYKMNILKSADAEGSYCNRYTFSYAPKAGVGHFIHTYEGDGNPLPTFQGEPERISISDSIDDFTEDLWNNLNEDNKISLYVRYIDLATGEFEEKLINKNK